MYEHDERVVLTLDAGGTNFVFSAIRACREVIPPICLPAVSDNLDGCLSVLVKGFRLVKEQLEDEPVAISFAFPGPADYGNGVIGDLPNFPAFRGGVALGPYLEEQFGIPVFINNDGNLFAYGEALAGALPEINRQLKEKGNNKQFSNLLGITFGTGFGAGVVINNVLLTGDNGCGGDVWIMRNKKCSGMIAEESVSIRAVKRVYKELSGESAECLTPKDIFDIAEGVREGNRDAAIAAFEEFGEMAGDTIATALTIVDGIVVIGGGLSGASKYILPALLKEMKSPVGTFAGEKFPRMEMDVYNLEDMEEKSLFLADTTQDVLVPGSGRKVPYRKSKQVGVLLSANGASRSIMLGAYAFALQRIDLK
ncbi:ROK family protein [Bacteroides sp.]